MPDPDFKKLTKTTAVKQKKKRRVLIVHINYSNDTTPLYGLTDARTKALNKDHKDEQCEVRIVHINGGARSIPDPPDPKNEISVELSKQLNWLKEGSKMDTEGTATLEIIQHGENPDQAQTREERSGSTLGNKLAKHTNFEEFGYFEGHVNSCYFGRENNEGISQLQQFYIELMDHGATHFVGKGSREHVITIVTPTTSDDLMKLPELKEEVDRLEQEINQLSLDYKEAELRDKHLMEERDKAETTWLDAKDTHENASIIAELKTKYYKLQGEFTENIFKKTDFHSKLQVSNIHYHFIKEKLNSLIIFSILREKYPGQNFDVGTEFNMRESKNKNGFMEPTDLGLFNAVGTNGNFVADVYYSPNPDSEQPQLVKILTPDGVKAFTEKHMEQAKDKRLGQSAQNSRTP